MVLREKDRGIPFGPVLSGPCDFVDPQLPALNGDNIARSAGASEFSTRPISDPSFKRNVPVRDRPDAGDVRRGTQH